MITEDYVSFEIAKLLKEKGFDDIDCECHGWIGRSGKHYSTDDTFYDNKELKKAQEDRKEFIPLITLQMAMKWLREMHNIDIFPWKIKKGIYSCAIFNSNTGQDLSSDNDFPSEKYEEVVKEAIKYCLENLI